MPDLNEWSDEAKLLLACSRLPDGDAGRETVKRLIAKGVGWRRFSDMASQHQMEPLVFNTFRATGLLADIPAGVSQRLEDSYNAVRSRNETLIPLYEEILESLGDSGIDMIVLKGIVLLKTVYADVGLRSMNDLDLVVSVEDLAKTQDALRGMGFTTDSITSEVDWYDRYRGEVWPYVRETGGTKLEIDLHFNLCGSELRSDVAMPLDEVWDDSIEVRLGGVTARTLSHEDAICFSGLRAISDTALNQKMRLRRWCDLAETIKRHKGAIDWDALWAKAHQRGLGWWTAEDLRFVRDHLDVDVDDSAVSGGPADSSYAAPYQLRRGFERCIEDPSWLAKDLSRKLQIKLFASLKTKKDMVRFLANRVLPSKNYLCNRYKPKTKASVYLFYLLHVFRALVRACRLNAEFAKSLIKKLKYNVG